jgi:hypothetical protein
MAFSPSALRAASGTLFSARGDALKSTKQPMTEAEFEASLTDEQKHLMMLADAEVDAELNAYLDALWDAGCDADNLPG